jgi:hypothetical protein
MLFKCGNRRFPESSNFELENKSGTNGEYDRLLRQFEFKAEATPVFQIEGGRGWQPKNKLILFF